jgi:ribonuclease-3
MTKPGPNARNDARLDALEERIGHVFANRDLLREALTHASALDGKKNTLRSYDRLEFLGDRVLGLIVSARLFGEHGEAEEDGLAPRFNALVNRGACARAARRADLGAAIVVSPSEEQQGGRAKEAILADVCESVLAALYLDGGMAVAEAFVTRFWAGEFAAVDTAPRDAKTALQEWAAAKKRELKYVTLERSGPEHAPVFVVEAHIDGFAPVQGQGPSKRDAQRAAAAAFLKERGDG